MLGLFQATWGKYTNAAAIAFVTPRPGHNRSRTRGGTAKLLPPRLAPTTNLQDTTPTIFYLQVVDLHGILSIGSLTAASPLA